jgi:hypothetical protein
MFPVNLTATYIPDLSETELRMPERHFSVLILLVCFSVLAAAVLGQLLKMRMFGFVFAAVGPTFLLYLGVMFSQWTVFGPITNQYLFYTFLPYTEENWNYIFYTGLVMLLFVYPFYESVQRSFHLYYRHQLLRAFFKQGDDMLLHKVAQNPWSPLPIIALTLNLYQPPNDPDPMLYQHYVLTSTYMGSLRTGFVPIPHRFKLSKGMACSGAAIDGVALAQKGNHAIRFWLVMLNLSLGSWVRVDPKAATKGVKDVSSLVRTRMRVWRDRVPDFIWMFSVMVCFLSANLFRHVGGYTSGEAAACNSYFYTNYSAMGMCLFFLCAMFFVAFSRLRWIYYSPLARQLLMIFGYPLVSPMPSRYLYLTDGGITDDLGLLPMVKRRLKHILVADCGTGRC